MSSDKFGTHPVFASEASEETFNQLAQNATLNNNRFCSLNFAISNESGKAVTFKKGNIKGGSHAGAHVLRDSELEQDGTVVTEKVTTTTIVSLVKTIELEERQKFVLKLDVERQKVNALQGALELLAKKVLIIYEDHGNDFSCEASSFILHDLELKVFYIGPNCHISEMSSIEQVREVKQRKNVGYNFFACNAPVFIELFRTLRRKSL